MNRGHPALALGVAFLLVACSTPAPRMPVGDFVQKIEKDEINAHSMRDEWVELDGILAEKHVDQSNKLLLSGQNNGTNSLAGGRKGPIEPATAILVDSDNGKTYSADCEFSEFGADKLNRTKTGSHVTVRGILRSWKRIEGDLVPWLESCSLQ